MTPEEREKLDQLCMAIKTETDSAKLAQLAEELNKFLEQREQRLMEQWKKEFV